MTTPSTPVVSNSIDLRRCLTMITVAQAEAKQNPCWIGDGYQPGVAGFHARFIQQHILPAIAAGLDGAVVHSPLGMYPDATGAGQYVADAYRYAPMWLKADFVPAWRDLLVNHPGFNVVMYLGSRPLIQNANTTGLGYLRECFRPFTQIPGITVALDAISGAEPGSVLAELVAELRDAGVAVMGEGFTQANATQFAGLPTICRTDNYARRKDVVAGFPAGWGMADNQVGPVTLIAQDYSSPQSMQAAVVKAFADGPKNVRVAFDAEFAGMIPS